MKVFFATILISCFYGFANADTMFQCEVRPRIYDSKSYTNVQLPYKTVEVSLFTGLKSAKYENIDGKYIEIWLQVDVGQNSIGQSVSRAGTWITIRDIGTTYANPLYPIKSESTFEVVNSDLPVKFNFSLGAGSIRMPLTKTELFVDTYCNKL